MLPCFEMASQSNEVFLWVCMLCLSSCLCYPLIPAAGNITQEEQDKSTSNLPVLLGKWKQDSKTQPYKWLSLST